MDKTSKTLRHEVFTSAAKTGPWQSLGVLKNAAEEYINEHSLVEDVVNISESIYAWARDTSGGVSRSFVTVWFRCPRGVENPVRTDLCREEE